MAALAPRSNISAVVAQVIAALQQSQGQTVPPPAGMPPDLLATAEILGQEPGGRRPIGAAGIAFFAAWTQAANKVSRGTILRGNGQLDRVGSQLPIAPAITITNGFGLPSSGVHFTILVTEGGGSVVPASGNTGQDGVASAIAWTLGPKPGPNRLQIRVSSNPLGDFVAVAVPARRCDIVEGNGQTGTHATALRDEPKVKVVDAVTGDPLKGLTVTFTIKLGDGDLATKPTRTATTDQDGFATAGPWTLGPKTGGTTNTLDAEVDGADLVTFTAQAT